MGSRVLNPSAQAGQEPYKRQQIRSEQHLREMETILGRMADLLRIFAEEIVVFDYFHEKYRLQDTDLEPF